MLSKIVTTVLVALGSLVAGGASVGCMIFFLEEPEMPNCLIEK
jgi:hypothetical protein